MVASVDTSRSPIGTSCSPSDIIPFKTVGGVALGGTSWRVAQLFHTQSTVQATHQKLSELLPLPPIGNQQILTERLQNRFCYVREQGG